jgi:hypothetical protein
MDELLMGRIELPPRAQLPPSQPMMFHKPRIRFRRGWWVYPTLRGVQTFRTVREMSAWARANWALNWVLPPL